MQEIDKLSIFRKSKVSRCTVDVTWNHITETEFVLSIAKAIDFYLVKTKVNSEDKATIWCSLCTTTMWSEVSLGNGSKSLVIDAIDNAIE